MSAPAFPVHLPAMMAEALAHLAPRPGGLYCDATVGGGGHAEQILLASAPDGRLIGVDRDPEALAMARERLRPFGRRFLLLHGRFGDLRALLDSIGVGQVDGILADVGVSSAQLERPERGFSFQRPGPIDMRMDPGQGETALDLILRLDEEALAAILREYGEERRARAVARALRRAAAAGALTDTLALAQVAGRAAGGHRGTRDPATRTFQALRIAVNDELRQLDQLLLAAPSCLRPGGRLVLLAFHSLEDRLIKRRLRELSTSAGGLPPLRLLTRKPVWPSTAEVATNPRARSARLRAAARTEEGPAAVFHPSGGGPPAP